MRQRDVTALQVRVACFGDGIALAVARVPVHPTTHPSIAANWLYGGELDRNVRFAVDHARASFLAGRAAAKSAARALAPDLPSVAAWQITSGEHQRPMLSHVLPGFSVSLAHDAGVSVAMVHADRWRCGIDLEAADRAADDVIATQMTPSEVAWARAGGKGERERWLLLWTAHEAQGKSFGTGLLEPEHLAPTEVWAPVIGGWMARVAGDPTSQIRSVIVNGVVVTLVVPVAVNAEPMAAWLAEALAD